MKTSSPFEYAEVINVLVEGLHLSLFTKEQATQWADGFILRDEQPDIFFIELSLSHDNEDALSILSQAANRMDAITSPRPLFSAIYKQVLAQQKSVVDAALSLSSFTWDDKLLTQTESRFVYFLYYNAETLEVCSEITRQQLEHETIKFLSLYQEYTIENYTRWADLDQEVNVKLTAMAIPSEDEPPIKGSWWQFWKP